MNWRPMAEMPDELRDGRDVLLWAASPRLNNQGVATVGYYCHMTKRWWTPAIQIHAPAYFAEITTPWDGDDTTPPGDTK